MSKELPQHKVVETFDKVDFNLVLSYDIVEKYPFSVHLGKTVSLSVTDDGIYFLKDDNGGLIRLSIGNSITDAYFGKGVGAGKGYIDVVKEFLVKSVGLSEAYIRIECVDTRVPFYSDCKEFRCSWRSW